MTYQANLKDYERLLASLSHKALRRATARGYAIEFDDLFQEAKITFVHAMEKFNPELGVKFSTYLWTSVKNNLLRLEGKVGDVQRRTVSIDRQLDEDGGTFHDILGDNSESIEDRMERMERESDMFERLSGNARRVIAILDQPPTELVREIRRMEAFRSHCKTNKYAAAVRNLDVHTVCAALGFSEKETRQVKREFKQIMEETYG